MLAWESLPESPDISERPHTHKWNRWFICFNGRTLTSKTILNFGVQTSFILVNNLSCGCVLPASYHEIPKETNKEKQYPWYLRSIFFQNSSGSLNKIVALRERDFHAHQIKDADSSHTDKVLVMPWFTKSSSWAIIVLTLIFIKNDAYATSGSINKNFVEKPVGAMLLSLR